MVSIVLWQHCDLMMMWSSCVSVTSHWSHSSRLPVTSYCDTTVSSRWCGHLVYLWHHTVTILWPHADVLNLYHRDLTTVSKLWCHNFDVIRPLSWSHMVSIVLWQHCDLMMMWPSRASVTSHCDDTVTSRWCSHLMYLWHHTVTTLWPHGDVVKSYHCDLTQISKWWCHNFDIIVISHG